MNPLSASEISTDEIRNELNRILSSVYFKASKRRKRFLQFVVEQSLSGKADTIKAYTIAVSVFGRGEDFNPQIDPIVSVEAGRLRRALEHYYLTAGADNALRIAIPKGTFAPRFLHKEIPPTELEVLPAEQSPRGEHGKRYSSKYGPRIAVIVFRSLSEQKDQAFYAAGFSGQIIANLYRYKDLAVVGPLAGKYLADPNPNIIDIGRKYGVQFILSGSVQPRGNALRVTAWLVDAETEENLWVERFDRDLSVSSLYEIEDEITQRIVATLADRIGVITRVLVKRTAHKPIRDLTAFEATLKMYHWGIVLTEEAFLEAWRALESAVKKAPDYALSKAMLANVYASDYLSEIGLVRNRMDRAETLAREAVKLDPQNPDARWVMGFVHFLKRRPNSFVKEFEAALALNPNNPVVLAIYGLFLPGLGEWEKSIKLIEKARKLNPQLSAQYHIPAVLNDYRQGNFDQAYEGSLYIETPGLYWEPLFRAAVLGQLSRNADAQPYLVRLLDMQPTFKTRGSDLIRRLLYSEENVDMVCQGLQKAGLVDLG